MTDQPENIVKEIKKDFFAYRNGIVADNLRKINPTRKVIYGLNIPQLKELSTKYPHDFNIGKILWHDKDTRESRLLALYLIPTEDMDEKLAIEMVKEVETMEEAEFLAFKLLRLLPFAEKLYQTLLNSGLENPYSDYCTKMLKKNLEQLEGKVEEL